MISELVRGVCVRLRVRRRLRLNLRRFRRLWDQARVRVCRQVVRRARRLLGGQGHVPPSETITRGVIGVGGMGRGHVSSINTAAKLLAVCDVDTNHLKRAIDFQH